MNKYIPPLVVLLVALDLVLAGCIGGTSGQSRQVAAVRRGEIVNGVVATGNLSFPRQVDLVFTIAGTLKEIRVSEGEFVKKGQVLALLDDSTLQDTVKDRELSLQQQDRALESARLDLKRAIEQLDEISPRDPRNTYTFYPDIPNVNTNIQLARAEIQRALDDLAAGDTGTIKDILTLATTYLDQAIAHSSITQFIPMDKQKPVADTISTLRQYQYNVEKNQSAVEKAKAARESAQSVLDQARKQLEKAALSVPYDGVISDVKVKEGVNITLSTQVFHLVDTTQMEMKGLIDEGDVPKVKVGQEAIISLDAVPGVELKGKLSFINPTATIQAGVVSYEVVVTLESQSKIVLRDGMTASANMIIERKSNVLTLPRRAISGAGRDRYVDLLVDEVSSRTERKTITIGMSDDDNVEITSGLTVGDRVLVPPPPGTQQRSPGPAPGPGMVMPPPKR